MLERESSEQVQRYCRNCRARVRPGTRFCVSCGERLVEETESVTADYKRTDTTRYLSAAAYQDKAFRDQVIEQVVDEKYKAIGASYGVDIATVAKHCLIAKRFEIGLDSSMAVLLLLAVLLAIANSAFVLLPLLIAWFVTLLQVWISDLEIASNFAKRTFDQESSHFLFNGSLKSSLEDRVADIASEQNGNVVVYSGSRFSPFIGSGLDVEGWSFTLRIDKGKEELGVSLDPISFRLEELYDHLADGVTEFGLYGLTIEDKLYVDGQEIRDDKRFLRDPFSRPRVQVKSSLVKSFVDNPTQAVRYYKCIRVVSWKGELILSIFVRFTKVKNKLYAEVNYFLLPPLVDKYHDVDTTNPTLTLRSILNLVAKSLIKAPFLLAYSPVLTLQHIYRPYRRWRQQRLTKRSIEMDLAFDYGASISIRESATSSEYRRYFQKLDKEMNLKIVERQILDSIIKFLDSRNVDTSDLKDRQEWILNEGVIVSGGSIQAESLAVGKGAKSKISRLTGGARQKAPRSKK